MNYGLRPVLPHQLNLPSKLPAALQFPKDWQVTISQARKLLVGAEQRMTAAELRQRQSEEEAMQTARQNIQNAQIKQKLQADKRRSIEPDFEVGKRVLLSTKNIQLKHPGARKLLPLWIGPFMIVAKVGKVAFKWQLCSWYENA